MRATLALACFLSVSVLPAFAATIRVPQDQPTLQQGIDAAIAGDTVLVAPGTYSGIGNTDLDFHGRDIVFRSLAGPDSTIIDCGGAQGESGRRGSGRKSGPGVRGFFIHSGETQSLVIDGFTVRRGSAEDGGAILLLGSGSTIANCIISDNTAHFSGGGIYSGSSNLTMTECLISNNLTGADGGRGGGIFTAGGSLNLLDCTIRDNRVWCFGDNDFTLADGGGISASAAVTLTRCTFTGNSALATNDDSNVGNVAKGGGAFLTALDAVLTDCAFIGNQANTTSGPKSSFQNRAFGGGLACGSAILNNCTFDGNVARSDGSPNGNESTGGGLYSLDAVAIDCLFVGNSALAGLPAPFRGDGGGAAAGAGTRFIHCTFSGDSATSSGAAIHLRDAGTSRIENTIIAFSDSSEVVTCIGGHSTFLTCCDVYGNAGGNWVGCLAGQAGNYGNLSADPLFCDAVNDDYGLAGNSPCAPEQSPAQCGLIGARPVSCGPIGVWSDAPTPSPPSVLIFPNPLNEHSFLEWNETTGGPRTAHLYDVKGRVVVNRDLGIRHSGNHRVAWKEFVGERVLPSGVYFLKLDSVTERELAVRVIVRH